MIYNNLPTTNMKLGAIYNKESTIFRIWSPLRDKIQVIIYEDADSIKRKIYNMERDKEGVHHLEIKADLKGKFYTFLIEGDKEVTDPYSVASSMNSIRSAIIDLKDSNPPGWFDHERPGKLEDHTPIIYEVHVKDFTIDPSSGVENRGKYLGFIENKPLEHLKELGVTHIHLMPVYDFLTVREDKELFLDDSNYNWGYDPELYNVPEGSYASQPEDPLNRIKELKSLIMKLHENGFKVIMDVVYNHTYRTENSNLNILAPNYYYRQNKKGGFSNGSGTGNELASERSMVRKLIVDSVKYWVEEYKIDGFRFDLMALIDIHTIDRILYELRRIDPDVFIYGEPWMADQSPLSGQDQTSKGKQQGRGFAFFNDDFRNSIKGDNDKDGKGFIQGNMDYKKGVETGIAGSIYYDNSRIGFTTKSYQSINYINSHDNLIIRDKIKKNFPNISLRDMERLNKLAFSILFTAQGIPFFHSGNEFLRTKYMEHNSYNLPISINALDWKLKDEFKDFFNYFKELISFRKSYREFNLMDEDVIRERINFMDIYENKSIIAYTIRMLDEKACLLIVHNPNYSDYVIPKSSIIEHIREKCKADHRRISIIPIFDLEGIVKDGDDISYYYGIEVPHTSTMIYKIKPRKSK